MAWRLDQDGWLTATVTMPEGVQAEIDLPGSTPVRVAGGGHTFSGQLRLQ